MTENERNECILKEMSHRKHLKSFDWQSLSNVTGYNILKTQINLN